MAERLARAGHKVRCRGCCCRGLRWRLLRFRHLLLLTCAPAQLPVTFPFPWPSPILPPWLPHVRCCASSARPPQVVVVEQTETPDMLKERNEERAKKGLKRVGGVVCVGGRVGGRAGGLMGGWVTG
jgi:hypothetical protein